MLGRVVWSALMRAFEEAHPRARIRKSTLSPCHPATRIRFFAPSGNRAVLGPSGTSSVGKVRSHASVHVCTHTHMHRAQCTSHTHARRADIHIHECVCARLRPRICLGMFDFSCCTDMHASMRAPNTHVCTRSHATHSCIAPDTNLTKWERRSWCSRSSGTMSRCAHANAHVCALECNAH